ncbi:MAG TPA: hypothetical protein VER76_18420 [Pyrinomonadaceae bacterium]|nr:hypothetical protein [Pyrinomonadaceae bacterium]
MAKQNIAPQLANPTLAAFYDVSAPQIDALIKDRTFQAAFKAFNVDAAAKAFNNFTEKISSYNNIHRRERRLWSLKLGRGDVPSDLEGEFVKTIPEMRKTFKEAFAEIDKVVDTLSQAKFDKVVEKHLTPLMANLSNDKHPFTQVVTEYFRKVGCAPEMMTEFRRNFEVTQYNFMPVTGGTLSGLRKLTNEGVQAQVSIMDYTEKEGFSYLRGKCGPPAWAVAVAKILASVGISISAWVVVLIIVALFATLLIICNASSPGTWLRTQCEKVNAKFPIFNF